MKAIYVALLFVAGLFCLISAQSNNPPKIANPLNAPDLPGYSPTLKLIPAGSLIIPMDPFLQVKVKGTSLMSVLPYGLAIRTLWANVSLSWAIKSGKAFNGADLTAPTSFATWRAIAAEVSAPSSASWSGWSNPTTNTFYSGPLIILAKDVPKALAAWNAWYTRPSSYLKTVDKSVYYTLNVHYLQADVTVDIRHTINTHPYIAVSNLDGNAPTQTSILGCIYQKLPRECVREDGYGWGSDFLGNGSMGCMPFTPHDHAGLDYGTHYESFDCGSQVAALTTTTCLTTFSEPHWGWNQDTGPSYIAALQGFVSSGANFFAQCASIQSYENSASDVLGTFSTYGGIRPLSINATRDQTTTNYPDLPITQFYNPMSSTVDGAVADWYNYFYNGSQNSWTRPTTRDQTLQGYNSFRPNSFPLVTDQYDTRDITVDKYGSNTVGRNLYVAAGIKYNINNVVGSNIWYLGGHTWSGISDPGTDSGRRFFMNAILIPAKRPPVCGFTFCTAATACDAPDACTTCTCNSLGTGFVYAKKANCCLSDANCTASCTKCNTNTKTCELRPGCCSSTINCTQACTSCVNSACAPSPNCCTRDNQCGTSVCAKCENAGCITLPEPSCCNINSSTACSSYTCQTCSPTSNTCVRKTPMNTCCLANSECGGACSACDLSTNKCYKITGCCELKSECGSSPCLNCSNNECTRIEGCCDSSSQCGACLECSTTSNTCVPSSNPDCCVVDSDCGSCRRCVAGATPGSKVCVSTMDCCLTGSDCESCQNCINSVCVAIPECCQFDSDCGACETCESFNCTRNYDLSCCLSTNDCNLAREIMRQSGNNTVTDCDLECAFPSPSNPGVCKEICSSPTSYTGLIVGLAAGVPLGLLCLAILAAALIAFIYMKKKALSDMMVKKGDLPESASAQSPIYDAAVKVHSSPLNV